MSNPNIGQPLARVEGALKVTGCATYAADFGVPNVAHAVILTSTVAKGRITRVDTADAERAPGVLAVVTHRNAMRLPYREHKSVLDPGEGERLHVLQDDHVRFNGQPVAIVVAESLDQAEYAAARVRIAYVIEPARLDFETALASAVPPAVGLRAPGTPASPYPADTVRGDPEAALATAAIKVDAQYRIPREQHNPMEPHATIARWDGDRLTLWDKSQWVSNTRDELAAIFGLAPEQVHLI